MTKAFLLSEETKAILDAMIEERVKRLLNTAGRRWVEPDDNIQAPEVYLARIPGAGIAALTLGGDTGTGTGTAAADDVVGSADCEIYRLLSVSGVPTFASCGFVRKVYNTSTSAVPGGTWAPVARDKFGTWYVTGFVPESEPGSGSSLTVDGSTRSSIDSQFIGIQRIDFGVPSANTAIRVEGTNYSDVSVYLEPADYLTRDYAGTVGVGDQTWVGRKIIEPLGGYTDGGYILRNGSAKSGTLTLETPTLEFIVAGISTGSSGGDFYEKDTFTVRVDSVLAAGVSDYIVWNTEHQFHDGSLSTSKVIRHVRNGAASVRSWTALTSIAPGTTGETGTDVWAGVGLKTGGEVAFFVASGYPPSSVTWGVSGSVSLGATSTAGIITDLGSGSSASNGQLYIGTGSGLTLATLTAGNGISITNGSGSITIAAATQMSLTADGSGLKLSGDSGSPGNNYFYGTDGSGTKGWYSTSGFGTTQEQVEDWVGGMVNDTDSIQTTYTDNGSSPGTLTLDVVVSAFGSIIINAGNGLSLDGDLASPGNSKLYGTNSSGVKGWYDQPAGGSYTDEEAQDAVGTILVDTDTINFTYDDGVPQIIADVRTQMSVTSDATGVKLVSDSSSPGNSKYYGTDSGGTKGFHSLPTDFLNYVTAPAYSDSSGTINDYSYDSTYVYLCVATDTWKRWAFDSGFLPEPP